MKCFIQESLCLDPTFYCSSRLVTSSLNGEWNNDKRTFLTAGEKAEVEKLGSLGDAMTAQNVAFISTDHQRALATENDSIATAESRLTKGDEEPPSASSKNDDISVLNS